MICDCGATGSRRHRTWCATRLPEAEEAYRHALRNALGFYGFVAVALCFFAYRPEIANWWIAWRGTLGPVLAYVLPVAGLCWIAYRRLR